MKKTTIKKKFKNQVKKEKKFNKKITNSNKLFKHSRMNLKIKKVLLIN